ncbi:beta-ketoacyl synthase chain length factor [Denitromonas iodatirespirans]|uniref:Beta-ketoacyl synthase chain length factor n=1 Tax=Denitromonas iodatirespirans TaxID=2795389 RepID=A0A944DDU9_DENI1|nr:beta-ketoacyl synthase chain length factor [Denitromonas iodatirespirans]MBT0963226.1 beta-ketoacyl synthase chain length factor [Denitromonas iodatirespirans]
MDSFSLPIAAWEAWAPGRTTREEWIDGSSAPSAPPATTADVTFIDPMLRRRLGPVSRMALNVARRCLGDDRGIPMIFASRHGELARTLTLLEGMAAGDEVSPATFSLSVHNAAAGVLSIAHQDTAPATAIAAGEETLGMALVEAAARLSPAQPRLLLVYADAPVPERYQADIAMAESPHALALLFDRDQPRRLQVATRPADGAPSDTMMSLALLPLLTGHRRQAAWTGRHCTWEWTLADA